MCRAEIVLAVQWCCGSDHLLLHSYPWIQHRGPSMSNPQFYHLQSLIDVFNLELIGPFVFIIYHISTLYLFELDLYNLVLMSVLHTLHDWWKGGI